MANENNDFPSNEMLQFLTQIAFVGIEKGYFKESQEIFNVINDICPNSLEAKLSKALGLLVMGQLVEGAQLLFQVLKKDPENETARGFLILAFKLSHQDEEAQKFASYMLESCKDENMRTLAKDIVEDYKRRISPHELQAEQCQHYTQGVYVRH